MKTSFHYKFNYYHANQTHYCKTRFETEIKAGTRNWPIAVPNRPVYSSLLGDLAFE